MSKVKSVRAEKTIVAGRESTSPLLGNVLSSLMLVIGYLLLLLIGVAVDSRAAWLASFVLMAAISFLAWLSAYRRARAIEDTPTSNVASAAQGYVELLGRPRSMAGSPVLAPYSHAPCAWCRHSIEVRSADDWSPVAQGEAGAFMLEDATGRCVVDLDRAEVSTTHWDEWVKGDYRYSEWKLLENDTLYVLGEFHRGSRPPTIGDASGGSTVPVDCVRAPADGRPFLISNSSPAQLIRRYRLRVLQHFVIFVAAVSGLAYVWTLPSWS